MPALSAASDPGPVTSLFSGTQTSAAWSDIRVCRTQAGETRAAQGLPSASLSGSLLAFFISSMGPRRATPRPLSMVVYGVLASCTLSPWSQGGAGLGRVSAFLVPKPMATLHRSPVGFLPFTGRGEVGAPSVRGQVGVKGRRSGGLSMAMDLSIMSANVLAPIYFRIDKNGTRESSFEDRYLTRHQAVLQNILTGGPDRKSPPDVICLQEWWVKGDLLREQYMQCLCVERGYRFVEVERTNQRGDGLACFVSPRLELVDSRPILFLDCGDRVGVMVRVRVRDSQASNEACEALVVNTHLLFPHNPYSTCIRLREVQKALGFVDKYKADEEMGPLPIFFAGDLNGSPRGEVARYLREKGFHSGFEVFNSANDTKLQSWISHRSHRGQYVGVDYIWHLQPQNQSKPLAADWRKLVFGEIQKELPSAVRAAFRVFDSDDNKFIDPEEFRSTLKRLGFSGEGRPALTDEEIDFLFAQADRDDNGMLDFKEFVDRFWELDLYLKDDGYYVPYLISPNAAPAPPMESGGKGFEPFIPEEELFFLGKSTQLDNVRTVHVQDCFINPQEMEEGVWPPEYTASDHGFLTCHYRLEPSM